MAKDKPILFVQRQGNVLKAYAPFDAAILEGYRQGVRLRAELTESRSIEGHRLYWSVLTAVCAATGKWNHAEQLHSAIKVALDYYDIISDVDGQSLICPRSISFRAMDEAEFRAFSTAAYELITSHICPGMSVDELLAVGKEQLAPQEPQ